MQPKPIPTRRSLFAVWRWSWKSWLALVLWLFILDIIFGEFVTGDLTPILVLRSLGVDI